jgi:hypothetical protein
MPRDKSFMTSLPRACNLRAMIFCEKHPIESYGSKVDHAGARIDFPTIETIPDCSRYGLEINLRFHAP